MTVIIGNSTVRLTFWKALGLMGTFSVTLVASTWALSGWIGNFKQDLKDLKHEVKELKAAVASLPKRDSSYFVRITRDSKRIDSLEKLNCFVPATTLTKRPAGIRFYTQIKDANGHIILKPVNN